MLIKPYKIVWWLVAIITIIIFILKPARENPFEIHNPFSNWKSLGLDSLTRNAISNNSSSSETTQTKTRYILVGARYQNGGCIEQAKEPAHALERFLGEKSQNFLQLGHQVIPGIDSSSRGVLIVLRGGASVIHCIVVVVKVCW